MTKNNRLNFIFPTWVWLSLLILVIIKFRDLGFEDEYGGAMPGISILQKGKDGKMFRLEQTNVPKGDRAPSVLEVLGMIPDVELKDLAWGES